MITPQLLEYIKERFSRGSLRDEIRKDLIAGGWQMNDIEEAFSTIARNASMGVVMPKAGELLNEALGQFRKQGRTYIGIMAIPFLLLSGIELMTGALIAQQYHPNIIGALFTFITLVIANASLIYALVEPSTRTGIPQAYQRALHGIFPFFWVAVLYALTIAVGFALFIVPGIMFMVLFCFAPYIVIFENERGVNALLKSREYVRGKIGYVSSRILYLTGITLVIQGTASFLSYFASGYNKVIVLLFANAVSYLFLVPLCVIYLFLLYQKIKETKGEAIAIPHHGKRRFIISFILYSVLAILVLFIYLMFTIAQLINEWA